MTIPGRFFCYFLLAGLASAAEPTSSASAAQSLPPPPKRDAFVFSLVPKAFQRHPRLDFHVITEITEEGKKRPAASPAHPNYYLDQPGKFTQLGKNTSANEHEPPVAMLTLNMEKALAENGFLRATPATPLPSIVVVFNYGSFERFSTEVYDSIQAAGLANLNRGSDPNDPASGGQTGSGNLRDMDSLLPIVLSGPTERTDVLQRAELVGGEKFARQLADVLDREAKYQRGNPGSGMSEVDRMVSPFHQFVNANVETLELVDESFSSCYFVIASAYDYGSMRKGKRVLLWRTKMTVNSAGISMSESLPTLIVGAGPYFGREMTDPVTFSRRISREGKVEVGTPEVVEEPEAKPANASTDAGKKQAEREVPRR